jgi:hypothetical protein
MNRQIPNQEGDDAKEALLGNILRQFICIKKGRAECE